MRRVLVVDDDEVSREVLELLLTQEGFEVSTAESGDAAVAGLREKRGAPEAVLADLQMPGLCGNALARELRALCGEETALLAMSGSEPAPEQVAEYDDFLLKPFAAAEVTKALRWKAAGTTKREAEPDGAPLEDSKVLDATVFAGFAAMMRKEQLGELYGLCLRDAAKSRAEMMAAAGKKDDAEFRRAAHAMKGSFGMLGARELQGMCAVLERSGLSGDASMTSLDEITMAMGRLRRMLMARGVELPTETS